MDDSISKSRNLCPRDVGMLYLKLVRKEARCLADDLEMTCNGVDGFLVG